MPVSLTFAAVCAAVLISFPLSAQTPPTVVSAIRDAKAHLADGHPHTAVETLERQLQFANGDKEFNAALRTAYAAELKEAAAPAARERVRAKLALLGDAPAELLPPPVFGPATTPVPAPVSAPDKPAGTDWIKQATGAFNRARSNDPGQFLTARDLFNLAFRNKVEMTSEQTAAWAYCRLKVAADKLNKSTDATTAAEVAGEVEAALQQVPNHAALQETGRDVLAVAKKRAGNRPIPKVDAVESAGSFTVNGSPDRTFADKLTKVAEGKRAEIFARWSGPPGGKWSPACELVIHANAAAFEQATKLPAGATGRADVKLQDGVAVSRRIDLRADDPTLLDDALPRELTTVILADLFASQAPPKWVELGMAVLATSDVEVGRYLRTVSRCHRDGDLPSVESLLKAADIPAKGITGFYVVSVSLVDFLVRWQGEKTFTAFVRDGQRYGVESALKRQYGVKDYRQLEDAWRANVLEARK